MIDFTSSKTVYSELIDLQSDDVLLFNSYHGHLSGYRYQKVVIFSRFGEQVSDQNLLNILHQYKNSYVIIITTETYSSKFEEQYNCKIIKIPTAYSWYSTQMPKVNIDFNNKNFKKYFLSLNNRAQWNRLATLQFLLNFKLLDKFYFSYHHGDRFNNGSKILFNNLTNCISNTWYNKDIDIEKIFDILPIKLNDQFSVNDWTYGNVDYYNNSFCSLVSETYINENYNAFFTEKVMKPFAYGHPFLLFSSAGALQKLQSLGFETFSLIFDELYDTIDCPHQRLEILFKQIIDICNKSVDDLYDMYDVIKPKLEYNYEYFWYEFPKKYQKDIAVVKEQIIDLIGNV